MAAIVNEWLVRGPDCAGGGWRVRPARPCSKVPGNWTGYNWLDAKGWQNDRVPTVTDLTRYQSWPPCGICLVLGRQDDSLLAGGRGDRRGSFVVVVDADVYDPALADTIEASAIRTLGKAPQRVGEWPKRVLLYRCSDAIEKFATAGYRLPVDPRVHRVEFLGAGRQVLLFGRHPCGDDYRWSHGSPATLRPSDLTKVTLAQLEAFRADCEAILRDAGGIVVSPGVNRQAGGARHRGPPKPVQHAGLLALIEATGSVVGRRGDKINIRCPFADEHPNRGDSGTALLSGGGIKCQHTTCDGRKVDDFIAKLKELCAEDGQDGEAIYAEAAAAAEDERLAAIRDGFIRTDDDALERLWSALIAGDAMAIDQAAAGVAYIPDRRSVLDILDGADALDIAGTDRVRAVLDAADAEDAMRAAAWNAAASIEAQQSDHWRLVRRARAAEAALNRRGQAARKKLMAALGEEPAV